MACTWPEIKACRAVASSSKRRITVPGGATALIAMSCVLARATPTVRPLRSAAAFTVLLGREHTIVACR